MEEYLEFWKDENNEGAWGKEAFKREPFVSEFKELAGGNVKPISLETYYKGCAQQEALKGEVALKAHIKYLFQKIEGADVMLEKLEALPEGKTLHGEHGEILDKEVLEGRRESWMAQKKAAEEQIETFK